MQLSRDVSKVGKSGCGVLASLGLNAERHTVANETRFEAGQNAGVLMHWAGMNPKNMIISH